MRRSLIALILVIAAASASFGDPPPLKDNAPMVRVTAGGFQMGRDLAAMESFQTVVEAPRHVVDTAEFLIDIHEVTNDQFARFVAETGHRTDAEIDEKSSVWSSAGWVEVRGADWRHPEGPNSSLARRGLYPVVHVSYRDAASYAKWAGKRLPTEAEWEKAARGLDDRPWPWGPVVDPSRCNCKERGVLQTMAVGSFPAGCSPWGLADMAGNVREWTDAWMQPYPGNPVPLDIYGKNFRVVRGGSFYQTLGDARTFVREWRMPRHHESVTGFRCALTPAAAPRP